jgi:hypothetical protein
VSARGCALATLALLLAVSGPAPAQTVAADPAPRGSWMGTLLERTFLGLDVLTVDICFDAGTAARLARLAASGSRIAGPLADSVMHAALEGERATARVVFRRDLSLRRFLDTVGEDQRRAVAAGLLSDSVHQAIKAALPLWFEALETRGIRNGDQLLYEMGRDTIRSTYLGREGSVLLERTDAGRERRNSVLGTWLAPGASLRAGLLRSLEARNASGGGWERGGCGTRPASGRAGQSDSKRPWKNRSLAGS